MDQKKLIERLRNPQKFQQQAKTAPTKKVEHTQQTAAPRRKKKSRMPAFVGGAAVLLLLISLLFLFAAQKKAENITGSLDPSVLQGLVVDKTFAPDANKRYVQISTGPQRTPQATTSGSVLPIISPYNYRALTNASYALIGEAPFALSLNVEANLENPDLLRYLFNEQNTIDAFLKRPDVAPLLRDPAQLAALAGNEEALKKFFGEETMQQVLQSEELVRILAGSRLFAYLLVSKSVKYYRDHPAAAVQLIQKSPTLSALKQNPNVRKAVQENRYLKNIAATLLK